MVKRATIQDVAKAANLSVSTVSRALHDPDKVRKETLQIVLDAAEAVQFYGLGTIKEGLSQIRPIVRIGFLLLQKHRQLYRNLAASLEAACQESRSHEVICHIEHIDELTPKNVAASLHRLGEQADLIGVVAAEHPLVSSSIEMLAAQGKRIFALISPLSARVPVGYIGLDSWKLGRTGGWALHTLCPRPGKIGIMVGNHRYRCQETAESGFRSYFREYAADYELLDAGSTFETASIGQEITEFLLKRHPDLVGLYVCGGGLSGVLAALRNAGRAQSLALIGHDLTEVTRSGLLDGSINLLLSHRLESFARETLGAMLRCFDEGPEASPPTLTLPFDIYTPENL